MLNEPVYIALGSNLSEPAAQVKAAISLIANTPGINVVKVSSLYQSKPLAGSIELNQSDFVNAVIEVATQVVPEILLQHLLEIELIRGRKRAVKWGSRIIDCDILLYGKHTISLPQLKIPHPEMRKRSFVLFPLYEIAPDLVFQDNVSLRELISQFDNKAYLNLTKLNDEVCHAGC